MNDLFKSDSFIKRKIFLESIKNAQLSFNGFIKLFDFVEILEKSIALKWKFRWLRDQSCMEEHTFINHT